jgi:hypothetical protein
VLSIEQVFRLLPKLVIAGLGAEFDQRGADISLSWAPCMMSL